MELREPEAKLSYRSNRDVENKKIISKVSNLDLQNWDFKILNEAPITNCLY